MERFRKYLQRKSIGFSDRLEIKGESSRINPWLFVSLYMSFLYISLFIFCTGNLVENIIIYEEKKERGTVVRENDLFIFAYVECGTMQCIASIYQIHWFNLREQIYLVFMVF